MFGVTAKQVAVVFGIGVAVGATIRTAEIAAIRMRQRKTNKVLEKEFTEAVNKMTAAAGNK